MLIVWFKLMLFVERFKLLIKIECFIQWLFLLYVVVGIFMFFILFLWGFLYKVEFFGWSVGYIQFGGFVFVVEGYLLVIVLKFEYKFLGYGYINIIVFIRLIFVNMFLIILYLKGIVLVCCIVFIVVFDNFLVVGVFLVWIFIEEGVNLGLFFKEIFDFLL